MSMIESIKDRNESIATLLNIIKRSLY